MRARALTFRRRRLVYVCLLVLNISSWLVQDRDCMLPLNCSNRHVASLRAGLTLMICWTGRRG